MPVSAPNVNRNCYPFGSPPTHISDLAFDVGGVVSMVLVGRLGLVRVWAGFWLIGWVGGWAVKNGEEIYCRSSTRHDWGLAEVVWMGGEFNLLRLMILELIV